MAGPANGQLQERARTPRALQLVGARRVARRRRYSAIDHAIECSGLWDAYYRQLLAARAQHSVEVLRRYAHAA